MRAHAQVVIVGAGIVGCSVAYHLTRLGCTDVVVLDQGPLFQTGGSTSHAPGLMFQLNASKSITALARDSVATYRTLALDGRPIFDEVGSLEVAYSPERWEELKRKEGHAKSWGLPAELISAGAIRDLIPLMRVDHLHGAIHVPSDGVGRASALAEAMARSAAENGGEFNASTRVEAAEVSGGRIRALRTSRGVIACEQVLICAGIWGPLVGRMVGVGIPLTPVEHLYVRTGPLRQLAGTREMSHPIVRHQDRSMYFRQVDDCYGVGTYRHEPVLVDAQQIRPPGGEMMPALMPFREDAFAPSWQYALELFPSFAEVSLAERISGMFSFTPDGNSLLGPSLIVEGVWVAEAIWITHAAGAARQLAEWMIKGSPSLDMHEVDYNRFPQHAGAPTFARMRGAQQYREVYDIIHPLQQMEQPRPLRVSPFHPRQLDLGATFFESAGWERPQWFESNRSRLTGDPVERREGWAARHWSPIVAAEHRAARESVALFDLTPFTKIEVQGPGALPFLQRIAANQMDQAIGKVTYTALLDERGRIQCDLTVTRLGDTSFRIVTGGGVGMHDLAWIKRQLRADEALVLTDVTSGMCCLGLWGPRARDVLQSVTTDDLSNEAFPYLTARALTVDVVPCYAARISYVGELGWEIYAPVEYGLRLWDVLWEAGKPWGIAAGGGGAFDSLRLEKGYRLWGQDITPDDDPYEAGLGFAVRLQKGEFTGRSALIGIRERGVARKLRCMVFEDDHVRVMGKEPILDGARVVGYVTSSNFGYTVGRGIAYGYLPNDVGAEGTRLEIQYFGHRYGVRVVREPLHDPNMDRLRGTEPPATSDVTVRRSAPTPRRPQESAR